MIETHAHLYDKVFKEDLEEYVQRAKAVGVKEIWMPNCSSETLQAMLAVEDAFPAYCVPMIGLHPCYVNENITEELALVERELERRPYQMIGEIGLDFYWDLAFVDQQEKAFLAQLEMAKAHNLPICIHSRNSKDNSHNAILRACELIKEFNWSGLRGIFHCFSGNLAEAKEVISLNFMLGIGGVSTFKNGGLDTVLPYISTGDIVLETDAPYLAPVPHRGKTNEVAFIDLVADRVALLMGVSKDKIVEVTTANARTLIAKL